MTPKEPQDTECSWVTKSEKWEVRRGIPPGTKGRVYVKWESGETEKLTDRSLWKERTVTGFYGYNIQDGPERPSPTKQRDLRRKGGRTYWNVPVGVWDVIVRGLGRWCSDLSFICLYTLTTPDPVWLPMDGNESKSLMTEDLTSSHYGQEDKNFLFSLYVWKYT